MRRAALAVVLVAIAGCAGQPYWAKTGTTEAEFTRDHRECAEGARASSSRIVLGGRAGSFRDGPVVGQDLYRSCMEGRGYTRGISETGWRGVE
jgi:hypothetical protein